MLEDLSAVSVMSTVCSTLPHSPHADWLRLRVDENRRVIKSRLDCQTQPVYGQQPNAPGREEVVLVVDDEPVIAITLSEILNRRGVPSVWLTDAQDAVCLLGKLPLRLLISDIDMPGMDGVALAAMVRDRVRCPVLLFSAHGEDEETLKRVGALIPSAYIQPKPVSPELLLAVVCQLGAMHEGSISDPPAKHWAARVE